MKQNNTQNRELLFSLTKKDFRIDTFRSGGPGGQYQNTTDSGVRITHIESGASGESREERSQNQNKKKALEKLVKTPTFQIWQKRKAFEMMGRVKTKEQIKQEVEAQFEKDLKNGNIIIEETSVR
jgi:protein subunit release factor A